MITSDTPRVSDVIILLIKTSVRMTGWAAGLLVRPTRVRAAHALRELPLIAEAFGAGRLSWSKVRAMTRVATPNNESALVELARHTTAAQMEKAVRGMRRVRKLEQEAADPELAAYRMRTSMSYDRDGNFVLPVRASAEDGAVIRAAIERVQAELDRQRQAAAADVSAETPEVEDAAVRRVLCARHHTLVHRDGFQLVLHPDRRLTVTTANGVPVLHHPAMPWGSADALDPDRRIDSDTLPPDSITAGMNLDYVVSVLVQQAAKPQATALVRKRLSLPGPADLRLVVRRPACSQQQGEDRRGRG